MATKNQMEDQKTCLKPFLPNAMSALKPCWRFGGAVLILSVYLLPHTVLVSFLPTTVRLILLNGVGSRTLVLGFESLIILVWFCSLFYLPNRKALVPLWSFIGLLISAYFIASLQPLAPWTSLPNEALMVTTLGAGLLSTLLTGDRRQAMWPLFSVITALAIETFWLYLQGSHRVRSGDFYRAAGPFTDVNSLALCMGIGLLLGMHLLHCQLKRASLVATWMAFGFIYLIFLLTCNRGATLGAVLAISWYFHRRNTVQKFSLSIQLRNYALLIAFLVVPILTMRYIGDKNSRSIAGSNSGHIASMKAGWMFFTQNWLYGGGAGFCYLLPFPKNTSSHTTGAVSVKNHTFQSRVLANSAQNFPLQLLDEFGIVGGLIYILLLVGITCCSRIEQADDRDIVICCWIFYLVSGMFNFCFGIHCLQGNVLLGSLVGLTLKTSHSTMIHQTRGEVEPQPCMSPGSEQRT